jgi:hypothetical protein
MSFGPALSQAAGMMGLFDNNDAGVIAIQSLRRTTPARSP